MALWVEENIARFEISMDKLSWMHVLECFEELIDNELFMNLFENACSDDNVKV